MIKVVMHWAADKQRNAQVSGIWEFPGSREELLDQWRQGLYPTSHYLLLDATSMPPSFAFVYTQKVAYKGTFVDVCATGSEQEYWDIKRQADAIMERDGVLILQFLDDRVVHVHPLQAPSPRAKVDAGHLVLKCPDRCWLKAYAHGDIPDPMDSDDRMGSARWIESHLARCQKCFAVAAEVSSKMPCPDLKSRHFIFCVFLGQRELNIMLHCRPNVCRSCSQKRPSWYQEPW